MAEKKGIVKHCSIILTILILVTGSATAQDIPRSQLGSSFEIHYGIVKSIDRVKVQSQAAKERVTGGILGAATSGHHHRSKHAVEGGNRGCVVGCYSGR